MSRQDLYDRILDSLHGAALDDARWPATAELIERACGSTGTALVTGFGDTSEDVEILFSSFCRRGRRQLDYEREYFQHYHSHDERLTRLRTLPDSRIVPIRDLYSDSEKVTSPTFNELLPRFGAAEGLHARLNGPWGLRVVWGLADPRDRHAWTAERLETLSRLLPHVRQFVRFRQALVDAGALRNTFSELLENLRAGVIQLDAHARVVEANDRARRYLRAARGLAYRDGRLRATDAEQDAMLQRLLARAMPAPAGACAGGSMVVSGQRSSADLVLHLNPVDNSSPQARRSRVAALALLLDPSPRERVDRSRIASVLGLTPTESRLAALLAQGMTVREVAAATGRSTNTVRWHLKHIFAKHGLTRQIDLVQLVNSVEILSGPRR